MMGYNDMHNAFFLFQYTGSLMSDMSNLTSSIDLSSFKILTPSMKSDIEDIRNTGLDSINFTSINNMVSNR